MVGIAVHEVDEGEGGLSPSITDAMPTTRQDRFEIAHPAVIE